MVKQSECKSMPIELSRNPFRLLQQETGQNMVEFAFVISLLLLFTFAMVDFSRFVYASSTLHAAAQEGARVGIGELGYGNDVNPDNVRDAVRSKVMGLAPNQVNVTVSEPNQDTVLVAVTYEFSFITPLNTLANYVLHHTLNAGPWNMSSSASMLKQ